jgi:hypothetical protein
MFWHHNAGQNDNLMIASESLKIWKGSVIWE